MSLADGSALVAEFAAAAGWDKTDGTWFLLGEAPTEYAATNPAEDMAESIALAVIGRANRMDPARLEWIAQWLGESADTLGTGLPWIPVDADEVLPIEPLFDAATAASLANPDRPHIEPAYFTVADPPDQLAETLRSQLQERGWTGTLGSVEPEGYLGTFETPSGDAYLVEIEPGADGAETGSLLTYVAVW